MKKKRIFLVVAVMLAATVLIAGCSKPNSFDKGYQDYYEMTTDGYGENHDEYNQIDENPVVLTSDNSKSTFSLDVNTASYAGIRRAINENRGAGIIKNQVRIEEMVNYFKYDYPLPQENQPLSLSGYISECPWNSSAKLLTVGLRSMDITKGSTRNNLVFLLDVSGSMDSPDKIGLMQSAFMLLAENLNAGDIVSIVTYAGSSGICLDGAPGSEHVRISNIIADLTAGGSTAGASGINTAYGLAEKNFIEGGNNRIILATDGDFNVGVSSQNELEKLISQKRESGIYLSVLGFGYGNLKDNKLETLAKNGNGNYAYIDSLIEARRALVEEMNGTLNTVARDVKAQIEFNPEKVFSYRLLGYENKLLTEEDWDNTEKDAGEIGAGLTVTAVYEIVLTENAASGDFLTVSVKYKNPDVSDKTEHLLSKKIGAEDIVSPGDDLRFISCVVEAALIMRNSDYKGNADIDNVIARLNGIANIAGNPYKQEFLQLMIAYRSQIKD